MRKTKIICTIGPASEHEDVLTRMIKAGMDVARLNFSHGSHEEHQGKIDLIKKVRQKLHMPIAIMLDTKGPEYRIKTFENGKIELKDGDTFTLTTDDIVGNQERVSVNYENLIKDAISATVSAHTEDECREDMEGLKEEILKSVQDLFQSDFIYKVAISGVKFG